MNFEDMENRFDIFWNKYRGRGLTDKESTDLAWSDYVKYKEKREFPPTSWEDFCDHYPILAGESFISDDSSIKTIGCLRERKSATDKNILPSPEAVEQHLALMQLHQLRDCYRQGWKPNWDDLNEDKYCVRKDLEIEVKYGPCCGSGFLSFQTWRLAMDFAYRFKCLIIKAGDLL